MTEFAEAVDLVLSEEGGFVNDPSDPGGATNFGISLKFYRDIKKDATIDDIKKLTKSMAIEIYKKSYWDANGYDKIIDQRIANKVFSLSVVMGSIAANRCLQRALYAVTAPVDIDGVIGPKTLYAVNISNPLQLLAALKSEAAGQFRITILLNHELEKFINGWLNRAYS